MEGIKELKEVIIATNKLSVDIIEGLKDGVQFDDINIIIGNIDSIKTAFEGIDKVGAEIKDLDLNEVKELVSLAIDLVKDVLEAIKKEELPEPIKEVTP